MLSCTIPIVGRFSGIIEAKGMNVFDTHPPRVLEKIAPKT